MALNGNGGTGNALSQSILSISLTALLGLMGWLIFSTNDKLDRMHDIINNDSQKMAEYSAVSGIRQQTLTDQESRLRILETAVATEQATINQQHDTLDLLTKATSAIQQQLDESRGRR